MWRGRLREGGGSTRCFPAEQYSVSLIRYCSLRCGRCCAFRCAARHTPLIAAPDLPVTDGFTIKLAVSRCAHWYCGVADKVQPCSLLRDAAAPCDAGMIDHPVCPGWFSFVMAGSDEEVLRIISAHSRRLRSRALRKGGHMRESRGKRVRQSMCKAAVIFLCGIVSWQAGADQHG